MVLAHHVRMVVLFVLCLAIAATDVFAQAAARPTSEGDLLRREEVQQELGLSEAQRTQMAEAISSGTSGREVFEPFLQRMRDTSDEAERARIREEMQAAIQAARSGVAEKGLNLLDSRQKQVLRTIFIREAGVRALADTRIAADLKLSEEQIAQLAGLGNERREAASALGFNATDEQRDKFDSDWDQKYLAVLSDEQRAEWQKQGGAQLTAAGAATVVAAAPGDPAMAVQGGESVTSFGDAAEPGQRADRLSFNMRFAPWEQVLRDYAAAAGYTLDITQLPPGTFTHIDSEEYSLTQALDVINGYLQRRGYLVLVKDNFMVCLNVDRGIAPGLIRDVSVDVLQEKNDDGWVIGENELVRIEIPLERLNVGVMAQEVEQLLGPIGSMTAFTQTGSLIISDTGANLRRIRIYIESSLGRVKDELVFKSYFLKNIDVEEAEFMLLAQFGMRQGVSNVSAAASRDRRGPPEQQTTSRTSGSIQVFSDTRTNSLLVTASPEQQKLVEEIIKALDVNEDPEGNPLDRADRRGPYLKVYRVQGRADQVAQSINAMMPGVVVNEDIQAGTVHIFASEKQQIQVEEWVRSFAEGTGSGGSVAVIPLVRMDPLSAAATLRNLFIAESTPPTFETDLYGNRIIVKGTAVQIEQIREVLRDLGEDGSGDRSRLEGGNLRRYSLRGRDPAEFFEFLQREWSNQEKSSIRIVVPARGGPIRDLKTPGQGQDEVFPDAAAGGSGAETTGVRDAADSLRKDVFYYPRSERGTAIPVSFSQPDESGEYAAADIQIVVDGDELLLLSDDEEALDRLEEMMDVLQQSIPFRTRWTVFYLEASDATETASLLEQLMPSSSVTSTASSSGFSFGSMFSPLTQTVSDMTGLSGLGSNPQILRIIPDPRANCLYVTGPQALVEEAESLLQVLDSNQMPESLREMQPRRIPVEYAEIDDIATIVNDAFKPFMEPAGGRGQQGNPMAALFGGGGGGQRGGGNEPQGVQMTVAVDRQNSTLIVSSSLNLYQRVESLVKELDGAAKDSNRTVRVVQLKHADASLVQESLTSLFPRVTTSATRTSSSGSSSGGSGGSGGPPSAGPGQPPGDNNPFQQMMMDRMRSRGGDTGGSSRGGVSPFGGRTSGGSPFGGGGSSPFGGGGSSPFGSRGGFGGFGGRGGR